MCSKSSVYYVDMVEAFLERKKYGYVFLNLHHYTPLGSKLIADELFRIINVIDKCNNKKICEMCTERKDNREKLFADKILKMQKDNKRLCDYINIVKGKMNIYNTDNCVIGSIVMNANPFTNGHLYLVKQALKQVDYLVCFVVSENQSELSFYDRINMVKSSLRKYTNVLVVESGSFLISKSTFPEYFRKSDLQKINISMDLDIRLFAETIAPALDIKKRFVGEEPFDKITRQYNHSMKNILNDYDIELIEIERYKYNGEYISATKVRKMINNGNIDEIRELVPKETYDYLKNKFCLD